MIEVLSLIAKEAGAVLLSMRQSERQTFSKGERDFATDADLASQEIIVSQLKRNFPDIPIIAEEDSEHQITEKTFFTVDPLDGTFNYVYGFDTWGVLIGLVRDGEPHAGVVYLPEKNELLLSEKGRGAFHNDKKIILSERSSLAESIINLELGSWLRKEDTERFTLPIIQKALVTRSIGCSAVDFVEVAKGSSSATIAIYGSKIWDLAACVAVLLEAGGYCSDLEGKAIRWNAIKQAGIFSANIRVHEEIVHTLLNC